MTFLHELFGSKPPIGIMPLWLWRDQHADPTLLEMLDRYCEVGRAVERFRAAKVKVPQEWLVELGVE